MTWGTTNNEKPPLRPPPVYTVSPEAGVMPVEGRYSHLPQKSVLSVASLVLISGILCILLGIAHEVLLRDWKYLSIGCGIMFAVTGIIGIASVHRRTRRNLVATGILGIITCLSAVALGSDVLRSFCRGSSMHREKRSHASHDRDEEDDDDRRYMNRRIFKAAYGINIVLFILCLLVIACSIALAVFAFRTVTSPKDKEERRGVVITPVVSFPPSAEPNQLDSFNGN